MHLNRVPLINKIKALLLFCSLMAFGLMLFGCGSGSSVPITPIKKNVATASLQKKAEPSDKKPTKAVKSEDLIKKSPTYAYSSDGRRDIFKNLLSGNNGKVRKVKKKVLTPLEKYDISELKLVGVILGALGKRGVLRVTDGKVFSIKVGTPIGKNSGWVKKIEPNKIVIEEPYQDFSGKELQRDVTLRIRHENKEMADDS